MDERYQTARLSEPQIFETNVFQNLAYILNDEASFQPTGYKVLKSLKSGSLLPCEKLTVNGKVELVYFTSGMKTLQTMVGGIDTDDFRQILSNLLRVVLEVKNNGFLSLDNLKLTFDKVFIESPTKTVHMIYLPIKGGQQSSEVIENELRTSLVKIITSTPALQSGENAQLCADLSNGSLSLDDLYRKLDRNLSVPTPAPAGSPSPAPPQPVTTVQPMLTFFAKGKDAPLSFQVTKPRFILGRMPNSVDGLISTNPAIGRIHCQLLYRSGAYFVEDLESANKTYVNGKQLLPHVPEQIKNGDTVTLANSDFLIRI